MKISFIIPVYNVGDEIHSCLDSILKQDNPNYEIILINDGSTDKSGEICDYYTANYDVITVYHQENCGVSVARNKGISLAQGEYLCFIDADDKIVPDYIISLFAATATFKPDVIQFGYERISTKNNYSFKPLNSTNYSSIEKYYKRETFSHAVWSYAFKRELIQSNHLYFTEGLAYSEDQEFIIKSFFHLKSISVLNKILYSYIDRSTSVVNATPKFERALSQLHVAYNLMLFSDQHGTIPKGIFKSAITRLVDDFFIYAQRIRTLRPDASLKEYRQFYNKASELRSFQSLKLRLLFPMLFNAYYFKIASLNNLLRRNINKLKFLSISTSK